MLSMNIKLRYLICRAKVTKRSSVIRDGRTFVNGMKLTHFSFERTTVRQADAQSDRNGGKRTAGKRRPETMSRKPRRACADEGPGAHSVRDGNISHAERKNPVPDDGVKRRTGGRNEESGKTGRTPSETSFRKESFRHGVTRQADAPRATQDIRSRQAGKT